MGGWETDDELIDRLSSRLFGHWPGWRSMPLIDDVKAELTAFLKSKALYPPEVP
jgi:hypothetical protein